MQRLLFFIFVSLFSFSQIIFADESQNTASTEETTIVKSAEPMVFVPISYDKGLNVSTSDGTTKIRFNSLLKFRYFYLLNDRAGTTDTSTFQIPAARMSFAGNAFKEEYKYGVQLEFAGGDTRLLDFFTEYDYKPSFKLRVGQFKVPYSRQRLASIGNLLFTDRSIADEEFNLNRDIGLMFHGVLAHETFEYFLSAFNGNGLNQTEDNNKWPLGIARISYMPFGYVPYDERLVDDPDFKLAIGAAGGYSEIMEFFNSDTTIDPVKTIFASSDIVLKTNRLMFQGEFYYRRKDPDVAINQALPTVNAMGYYAQFGYFILPEKMIEVGARYSQVFTDIDSTDDYTAEISPIINYYFYKEHVKAQLEYAYLLTARSTQADINDHQITAQLQFKF